MVGSMPSPAMTHADLTRRGERAPQWPASRNVFCAPSQPALRRRPQIHRPTRVVSSRDVEVKCQGAPRTVTARRAAARERVRRGRSDKLPGALVAGVPSVEGKRGVVHQHQPPPPEEAQCLSSPDTARSPVVRSAPAGWSRTQPRASRCTTPWRGHGGERSGGGPPRHLA